MCRKDNANGGLRHWYKLCMTNNLGVRTTPPLSVVSVVTPQVITMTIKYNFRNGEK